MTTHHHTGTIQSFDDKKIYFQSLANDKNPTNTIVITHGLGGDSNATRPTIKSILTKLPSIKCITYDLRGHGSSTKTFPQTSANIESTLAHDIQSICQQLEINNPIFVGHSLGGIAIQTYLNNTLKPQPLHTFLIASPIKTSNLHSNRNFWHQLLITYSHDSTNPKTHRTIKDHVEFKDSRDLSLTRIISDISQTGKLHLPLMYLSILGWQNPNLQSINNPQTTIIFGDHDLIVRKTVRKNIEAHLNKTNQSIITSNHHQFFTKHRDKIATIIANQFH